MLAEERGTVRVKFGFGKRTNLGENMTPAHQPWWVSRWVSREGCYDSTEGEETQCQQFGGNFPPIFRSQ